MTRVRLGIELPRAFHLGYDPLAVAVGARAVWVAAKNTTEEVILRISPSTGKVLDTLRLHGADIQSIAVLCVSILEPCAPQRSLPRALRAPCP